MPASFVTIVLSQLAFAGGTAAFYWFLRRRFPVAIVSEGPTLEELQPIYRKWEWIGGFLMVLTMVALFYPWRQLLDWMTRMHAEGFEPAAYNFYAAPIVLAVPALFLAIASGIVVWLLIARVFYRGRFAEYVRYSELSSGFNAIRAAIWLASVMRLLSWGGFLLAMTWNVTFYDDHVVFRSFLGLRGETVRYAEIAELKGAAQVRAPNGNLVDRQEFWLVAKNGSRWTTNNDLSDMGFDRKRELFEFLARKTGLPIQRVAVLE